jgi:large subunit ribosomal protein L24
MTKQVYKIKLRVGDKVVVRRGKYKGKISTILKTHPTENKVTVEGVNVVKKHQKPNKEHPQGAIVELTKPVWVSNVAAYDPSVKKASKITVITKKDGNKVRTFKASGKEMK